MSSRLVLLLPPPLARASSLVLISYTCMEMRESRCSGCCRQERRESRQVLFHQCRLVVPP